MVQAGIKGTGLYVPGKAIDNAELKNLANVEFDDERLSDRIGISSRHIARLRNIEESTADFAEKAARSALKDAGVSPDEVDLLIVATDTPEFISPATAIVVQGRLQSAQRATRSFDVNASCAGFVSAFDTAVRIVGTDPELRYGVVVGVYNMPAFVRDGDAFGYSIFADGAGAVVLEKRVSGGAYLGGRFLTDGTQWDYVGVYSGGTKKPVTKERLEGGQYGLELLKPLPGKRNIELWPPLVEALLEKVGKRISEVDHLLFTQINRSVIHEVMGILGVPLEKTTTIMDRYGYTGSACIPMAFYHAVKEERVHRGDLVLCIASGAGLAVGANAFIY
ncbi:MAG TPA: ketoacyl-ACP synthase III [Spirochaetia bacterium]|nr:ketoacyl-ACP synthase III [Spirochaetia bacterium]